MSGVETEHGLENDDVNVITVGSNDLRFRKAHVVCAYSNA
jgi:hypothetical protein